MVDYKPNIYVPTNQEKPEIKSLQDCVKEFAESVYSSQFSNDTKNIVNTHSIPIIMAENYLSEMHNSEYRKHSSVYGTYFNIDSHLLATNLNDGKWDRMRILSSDKDSRYNDDMIKEIFRTVVRNHQTPEAIGNLNSPQVIPDTPENTSDNQRTKEMISEETIDLLLKTKINEHLANTDEEVDKEIKNFREVTFN